MGMSMAHKQMLTHTYMLGAALWGRGGERGRVEVGS